jgi:hypothetical protein
LDPEDVALFASKNKWMYSVLSAKLKTNTRIEIIQKHDINRNAQAVWRELVDHHLHSQVGVYKKEELMHHLMNHKYDSNVWKGLISLFIINYMDSSPVEPVGGKYWLTSFVKWVSPHPKRTTTSGCAELVISTNMSSSTLMT